MQQFSAHVQFSHLQSAQQHAAGTITPPDVFFTSQPDLESQFVIFSQHGLESCCVIEQLEAVQQPLSPQPEQLPSAHVQLTHTQLVQQHDF